MAADAADFLVREPVLKFEPDDLALIGRQFLEQLEDARSQLMAFGHVERPRGRVQAAKDLFLA